MFEASKTKVRRALKFIAELEAELNAHVASGLVRARYDNGRLVAEIKQLDDHPGAIVGDVIHNLRAALDLMASELARLNNRSDGDVYFPFSDSSATFDEAISRRRFDKAGADAVALLRQFQPYRGGNNALRALHELDIRDKHKSLVIVGHMIGLQASNFPPMDPSSKESVPITPDSVSFIFPEEGLVGGEPVVKTLKDLVEIVNGILEAFESMVALRTAKP